MYDELIKLADYFDSIGKDKLANNVDDIIKLSQAEDPYSFKEPSTDVREGIPKSFEVVSEPSQEPGKVSIQSHPLASAVRNVIFKLFQLEDPGVDGSNVSVEELESIYDEGLKYNSDLIRDESLENPISPEEFEELVDDIFDYVASTYKGSVREEEVIRDAHEFLSAQYRDVYLEHTGQERPLREQTQPFGRPTAKELTEEELAALNKLNDEADERVRKLYDKQEEYPEWAEQERDFRAEHIRRTNPEHADILLGED
jgi:hypothetical protein